MKTKINSKRELLESLWEQYKYCLLTGKGYPLTESKNELDDGSGEMVHGLLLRFDELAVFLNTLNVLAEMSYEGNIDLNQFEAFMQAEINILTNQKEREK